MYQTTLKRIAALAALTALTCLTALAQTISGVGKVTDLKGEALIGVSVVQKGTTNGVMTDVDG